jgi:RNase P subunit RPR2
MKKNPLLEKTVCPDCKNLLSAATSIESDESTQPRPNDLTICIYCASILIYNKDFSLRRATESDLDSLSADTLASLQKAKVAVTKRIAENRNLN